MCHFPLTMKDFIVKTIHFQTIRSTKGAICLSSVIQASTNGGEGELGRAIATHPPSSRFWLFSVFPYFLEFSPHLKIVVKGRKQRQQPQNFLRSEQNTLPVTIYSSEKSLVVKFCLTSRVVKPK